MSLRSRSATTALWLKSSVCAALLGQGHLGYDGANHEGVDNAAHADCATTMNNTATGHSSVTVPQPVADGGLRLNGEEEGRHEAVHLQHAWRAATGLGRLQVPMGHRDPAEDDPEQQPGGEEGQRKMSSMWRQRMSSTW